MALERTTIVQYPPFSPEATWLLLEQQVAAAQRYGVAFSCAVIDLSIPSARNAPEGSDDLFLSDVAARIQSVVRKADIVGSLGDQQLCVLFPHTSYRDALLAADRMVNRALQGPPRTPAAIGISSLEDCDSAQALISQALVAVQQAESAVGLGAFIYLGPPGT
jgi:diguanylate cyclase (GGDEF)-like protein